MNDVSAVTPRPNRPWLAYSIPPLILLAMVLCYVIAPDFYLTYILEFHKREYQVCEFVTVGSAFVGGLILLYVALRLWRLPHLPARRWLAFTQLIVGLAAIFFAGEEIDWGQTYLDIDTPQAYAEHVGPVTNLHNADIPIPVRPLGNLFLVTVFMIIPGLWHLRPGTLPKSWQPVIAEGPVVSCIIVAYAWSVVKKVYRMSVEIGERPEPKLYWEFIEEINEQKELLIAVTILMYAIYRLKALAQLQGQSVEA